jgi:hypothetical protein
MTRTRRGHDVCPGHKAMTKNIEIAGSFEAGAQERK